MSEELDAALATVLEDAPATSPFNEPEVDEQTGDDEGDEDNSSEADDDVDNDDDEGGDDESTDDDDQGDQDDDDSDDDDDGDGKAKTVPLAALHSERAKRKALADELGEWQQAAQNLHTQGTAYKTAFEDLVKQIEENDLASVVKINKPAEETPEVAQLRQRETQRAAQERQDAAMTEIHETVMGSLPEYPNIDSTNDVQGETLMRMILADVNLSGKTIDEAVHDSMKALNSLIGKTQKESSRRPVKPGKTLKKGGGGTRKSKSQPKPGSVEYFRTLGHSMFDEK